MVKKNKEMTESLVKSLYNIEAKAQSLTHLYLLIRWFSHDALIFDNQNCYKY